MFVATLVAGAPPSARRALIAAWRDSAPASQPWAVLRSAAADPAPAAAEAAAAGRPPREGLWRPRLRAGRASLAGPAGDGFIETPPHEWLETVHACLCCSPQPVLQAALARLSRRTRATRLLIDLEASGRPAALIDVLRRPPLSLQIDLAQVLTVLDADLARQALDAGRLVWLTEQLASADRLVLRIDAGQPGASASVEAELPDLANRLRALADFPFPVQLWHPSEPAPEPPCAPALAAPAGPIRAENHWSWRAPADAVFDRRALAAVLQEAHLEDFDGSVVAIFRTEREWYRYRAGATQPWEATLYRGGSRIEIGIDTRPDRLERLDPLAPALAACRIGGS